jgi:hypothetical protein
MTEIFVGKTHEPFTVHKDLLVLQSRWFATHFRNNPSDETKTYLPNLRTDSFSNFICWLYSGSGKVELGLSPTWNINFLQDCLFLDAPAYSNNVMDRLRFALSPINRRPLSTRTLTDWYTKICRQSDKGSLARKLVTRVIAHSNPLAWEGSTQFRTWEGILRNDLDFAVEFSLAAGRRWNGKGPCDDEYRAAYMEREFDLNERWAREMWRINSI